MAGPSRIPGRRSMSDEVVAALRRSVRKLSGDVKLARDEVDAMKRATDGLATMRTLAEKMEKP